MMSLILQERTHVNEPQRAQEYADVVSDVVRQRKTAVLHRDGAELAAIVPLEYLEELEDALAMAEAQRISSELDWDQLIKANPTAQEWFDRDEPKPF
jgi:hypothetical protein